MEKVANWEGARGNGKETFAEKVKAVIFVEFCMPLQKKNFEDSYCWFLKEK